MSRRKIPPAAKRARAASLELYNTITGRTAPDLLDGRIEAVTAARKAQDAGKARHAARKAGIDWEPVRAAIVEAGHADLLTPPIRAKELHTLPQLRKHSVPAFIKWLRKQHVIPSKNM